jgi:hypothetical protein
LLPRWLLEPEWREWDGDEIACEAFWRRAREQERFSLIGRGGGPGFHSEIVLMCDITLAADDAAIFDLHYDIGSVPAEGIHNAFRELLGPLS